MWPDFYTAVEIISAYKEKYLSLPPFEVEEEEHKRCSDARWALDDLTLYLSENWYEDYPQELIADYIDDSRYRAKKYRTSPMGPVYRTAQETAEDVIKLFI